MVPVNCWKLTSFLFDFFANIFDLISDWLFYTEQLLVKDGLVFGTYDHAVVMATFVICVIASLAFLVDFVFGFVKFFKNSDTVELVGEIITVITLLIEDLPQTSINVHLALCRGETTNAVQIIKASTAIFEALVKLIFFCIPLCRNKCKNPKSKQKGRLAMQVVTIILLVVIIVLSIVVLSATTNFHKSDIRFYSEGLDREDTKHYLEDVGVFMRLQTTQPRLPNMAEHQWMMLTYLTNITDVSVPTDGLFLSVIFTVPLQYIWVRKHFPGPPKSLSCYEWHSTSSILLPQDKCSDIISSTTNTTTVSTRFTYVTPSTYQPVGDIHYNSEIRLKFDHILTNETVTLKYFKVKPKVKGNLALTTGDSGGQYRFYDDQTDLQSVREVWKKNCENTGRESPKLDRNMFVRCVF